MNVWSLRNFLAPTLLTVWGVLLLAPPAAAGEDLGKVYKSKLDYEETRGAVDWTTGIEDVWALDSFHYALKGKFELDLGPATVVFGKHVEKKDQGVVWAALFPTDPGKIVCSESGHGEHARAIFLRFHPSLVGELFPKKTVKGPGDPMFLVYGKREYGHKINSGWQAENMPVVPWKHSLSFDIETVEGKRRRYGLDTKKKSIDYTDYFVGRTLPPAAQVLLDEGEGAELFQQAWKAFDAEYAMFVVKPDVDWDELRDRYEPLAARAKTAYEAAGVIGLLLTHLEDLHVSVRAGNDWVPTYNRFRLRNANWKAMEATFQNKKDKNKITWAETNYGLGYVNVWNLSESGMSDAFDQALEDLGHTVGLIVDLRFNGGGDETIGRRIAARFLDKERVYSTNQYRSGEKRDELGKVLERKFEPRGPWTYEAPVVVLQGQRTMSSAESLALMFAQCPNVTTMGDRTAGSSANPRLLELDHGIVIRLPRWLDMDPAGKPIDAVGIQPQKPVAKTTFASFRQTDPVFEAAIAHLKKLKNRKPGRRE